MRTLASASLCTLLILVGGGTARASQTPDAQTPAATQAATPLDTVIERWASAAGGWKQLERIRGAHLRAQTTMSGVAGSSESWITPSGSRERFVEASDQREVVWHEARAWVRDWNGKVLALQGRDLADQVSDAFVRSLMYSGFSRQRLAGAGLSDGGDDSTGALRVLRFTPHGGGMCELYLDKRSGLPVRAVRKPYDDEVVVTFDDWRRVNGVAMPFRVSVSTDESVVDTTRVTSITLQRGSPPGWRFEAPLDGPSDVTFANGDRALGIPFNFENDHIMIACRVNGGKPIWFMFDTGADVTVINKARLSEFGLKSFGESTTSGGGGATSYAFTYVARVEIGGVAILGQRNGVIDLSGLERLYGMPLGGILGYDFASRVVMVVDYSTRTLSLYAPSAPTGRSAVEAVPFVLEGGHPHVRGEVTVDDGPPIPADFVIDSGAAESANLTAPFVAAHQLLTRARKTPARAPAVIPGTEKQFFSQTTVRGHLRSLSLGPITLTDIPVNLQQGATGAYASASFSGTVGQRILQRFTTTYDYPRSRIVLEPNVDFVKPFAPRTTFGLSLISDGPDYTTFTVTAVRQDSPAAGLGFKLGDLLAAIDGKPASSWTLGQVRAALAADGTSHTVDVVRVGQDKVQLAFKVTLVSIED